MTTASDLALADIVRQMRRLFADLSDLLTRLEAEQEVKSTQRNVRRAPDVFLSADDLYADGSYPEG